MERSQRYIGCPDGVVMCVDHVDFDGLHGYMYHQYSREAVEFRGLERAMLKLDDFFDRLGFPVRGNNRRSFSGSSADGRKERMVKVVEDDELLRRHGDLGTFIIRVQNRQNSSWQGRVTWVDKNETCYFRSVLELLRLIDSAVGTEEKGA